MSIKKNVLQYYISTAFTYAYASSIIYIYIYEFVFCVFSNAVLSPCLCAYLCFFRTCVIILVFSIAIRNITAQYVSFQSWVGVGHFLGYLTPLKQIYMFRSKCGPAGSQQGITSYRMPHRTRVTNKKSKIRDPTTKHGEKQSQRCPLLPLSSKIYKNLLQSILEPEKRWFPSFQNLP